jgi:hypothetical protein
MIVGLLDLNERPYLEKKRAHPELRGTGWAQCHHPNNGDQSRLKAALVWAMVAGSVNGGPSCRRLSI